MSLSEKIDELVEMEFEKRDKSLQQELKKTKDKLFEAKQEILNLRKLNKEKVEINKQSQFIKGFKELIDENNFKDFLNLCNIKKSGIPINGMDTDRMPFGVKLFIEFYPDREKVFELMNFFNLEYPKWLHKVKLPFDYNEQEIEFILDNFSKISISNGCYFEGNIGFYWRTLNSAHDNVEEMLNRTFSQAIPFQLLFQNKLLVKDKFFKKIVNLIKSTNGYWSNAEYFYRLDQYNHLSEEQLTVLFELMPKEYKKLKGERSDFIRRNSFLLKNNPTYAQHYEDKISNYSGNEFYYKHFPLAIQVRYIKKINNFEQQYKLIQKMDIPRDEKIKIINEILVIQPDL